MQGCPARSARVAPAASGRVAAGRPRVAHAQSASSPRVASGARQAVVCAAVPPRVASAAAAGAAAGVGAAPKMSSLMSSTDAWRLLKAHATEDEMPHLRELMADSKRCEKLFAEFDGITMDFSRQARAAAAGSARPARRHKRARPPRDPGRVARGAVRRMHARAARRLLKTPRRAPQFAPLAAGTRAARPHACAHAPFLRMRSVLPRARWACSSGWRRRPRWRRRLRPCSPGST